MSALTGRPMLTHPEGEALRVAEGLVGRTRATPPDRVALAEPSAHLAEAAARTFAAACLRFLVDQGGTRGRTVMRRERRATGRLWDRALNDGLSLALSESTSELWWRTGQHLLPLGVRAHERDRARAIGHRDVTPSEETTREQRRVLRSAVPASTRSTGDALVFLLAHENASYLRLPRGLEAAFQSALRAASPLAALWAPDDASADPPAARARATQAVLGHARAIELLDEAIARSWLTRLGALVLHAASFDDLRARARAFAATLEGLLDAADGARALHLVRPIALFIARAPEEALPDTFDVRAHAVRVPGVRSMADRDVVLQHVHAIVDVARRLDDVRTRMAAERYGDERYEEAQLVVRMLDDVVGPQRPRIELLLRRLSGAVG